MREAEAAKSDMKVQTSLAFLGNQLGPTSAVEQQGHDVAFVLREQIRRNVWVFMSVSPFERDVERDIGEKCRAAPKRRQHQRRKGPHPRDTSPKRRLCHRLI